MTIALGWARQTHQRLPTILASSGLVLFLAAPQWWYPHGGTAEQHWTLFQQLTGNAYVYHGAILLIAATTLRIQPPAPSIGQWPGAYPAAPQAVRARDATAS